jgi:hypothetical protein
MSFTVRFKKHGDVQEDELKLGKKIFRYLGNESITKQGLLHTEINGEIVKNTSSSRELL